MRTCGEPIGSLKRLCWMSRGLNEYKRSFTFLDFREGQDYDVKELRTNDRNAASNDESGQQQNVCWSESWCQEIQPADEDAIEDAHFGSRTLQCATFHVQMLKLSLSSAHNSNPKHKPKLPNVSAIPPQESTEALKMHDLLQSLKSNSNSQRPTMFTQRRRNRIANLDVIMNFSSTHRCSRGLVVASTRNY